MTLISLQHETVVFISLAFKQRLESSGVKFRKLEGKKVMKNKIMDEQRQPNK